MSRLPLCSLLEEGLEQLQLDFSERQIQQLLAYVSILDKWNKAYNLTAVKHAEHMVSRHLLDSLAIIPYIKGTNFADVGTGAGLPGIPLAVAFPSKKFMLIDSNGKKTRFLVQAKQHCGLENVEIFNGRVEQFDGEKRYDGILSRAFADLSLMLSLTQKLLAPKGRFYAMKAELSKAEQHAVPAGIEIEKRYPLSIPGEHAKRELIVLTKNLGSGTQ